MLKELIVNLYNFLYDHIIKLKNSIFFIFSQLKYYINKYFNILNKIPSNIYVLKF